MSLQTLFDDVANHLLTQRIRAISARHGCSYRGKNNTSCAVGCLISDDIYHESMEGATFEGLIRAYPIVLNNILEKYDLHEYGNVLVKLMPRLQYIHDNVQPTEWPNYLENCAKTYNLEFNMKCDHKS